MITLQQAKRYPTKEWGWRGIVDPSIFYNPLINYNWSTTIDGLGNRQLVDVGTQPKYDADMYFGRGCRFNGVDMNITVDINSQVNTIYSFIDNTHTYDESLQTLTTYVINNANTNSTHNNYIFYNGLFTQSQKDYLEKYPEKFLYREDNILKSYILNQSEIDNVVAYLPMCETDGYIRDLVGYSESNNLIQFPISNWTIFNDGGASNITEDGSGNIVFDYVASDSVYLNIQQDVAVTNVLLKVRIVVDSIVGSIKIQDSDTDGSFGRIFTAGTYEFISVSNQPNIIIARNDGAIDTRAVISLFELVELSATYPIQNYTNAVRDDAIQLTKGLQTSSWKRDSLGVPYGGSFDRLECDGVGYSDTGFVPLENTEYALEVVLPTFSGPGAYTVDLGTSWFKIRRHANGYMYFYGLDERVVWEVPSDKLRHIVLVVKADRTVSTYIDTVLIDSNSYTTTYSAGSFVIRDINKGFSNSPLRLLKIHTTPQDPFDLFNQAVKKGLLI